MTCYRIGALLLLTLSAASPCVAQVPSPRDELLRFVTNDFGLCLVVNDLRGNNSQWEKSAWMQSLMASPLGQSLLAAPEFKELLKFQRELKNHLGVDWPTLRDDVLGDAVVLAYQPGTPDKPETEQGILLLYARRPEVLARVVDKLNQSQKASGDLKALETREHKGLKYICRVESSQSHFYMATGHFFAYTSKEELLKRVLEQRQQQSLATPPLLEHFKKAGADDVVAGLWINPRSFETELKKKATASTGPETLAWQAFLQHWKALDAVVLSCAAQDYFELKVTLLAQEKSLPASARPFFMEPAQPSDLWQRFPDNAILRIAARINGSDLATAFVDLAPPDVRQNINKSFQPLAALVGMDLARDIAPNVGPDWGLCVLPARLAQNVPQVMAALAVRPGPKDIAVDRALYRGVEFLAGLALFDYNRRHPAEPIRLRTLQQEKVEIKYADNDKLFPMGFQPACALKDGYLLLTTSPDAVAQFRATPKPLSVTGAAPVLRLSCKELAKALRQNRQILIGYFASQNGTDDAAARRGLDDALAVLDIIDNIDIARSGGSGQASLSLRICPAKNP